MRLRPSRIDYRLAKPVQPGAPARDQVSCFLSFMMVPTRLLKVSAEKKELPPIQLFE